jgi:hypothetical protein
MHGDRPAPLSRAASTLVSPPLRALSIRQPWVWCIATQHKDVENRAWKPRPETVEPPFDFAVHASSYDEGVELPTPAANLKLRALEAEACVAQRALPQHLYLRTRCIHAVVTCTGFHYWEECMFQRPSQYSCSPWGLHQELHWQLANARLLAAPVPCNGRLGLWPLPPAVEAAVQAQLVPISHTSGPR